MNLADLKLVSTTTATAAVAAVITVAVYQGHISATSGGQTVRIEPGATVEVRPSPPVPAPAPAPAVEREPVHVSPAELDRLRLTGDKNIMPDLATQTALDLTGDPVIGGFRLCVDITGHVANVTRLRSTRFDKYDQTIERTMRTWTYRPYVVDGAPSPACADITIIYSPQEGAGIDPCDPRMIDDDVVQAANQYANGLPAQALALIRSALACKADPRLYRLAALYACAAHDTEATRELVKKVPPASRAAVEQKCATDNAPQMMPTFRP